MKNGTILLAPLVFDGNWRPPLYTLALLESLEVFELRSINIKEETNSES